MEELVKADFEKVQGPPIDTATLVRGLTQVLLRFLVVQKVPEQDLRDVIQDTFATVHRLGGYQPGEASAKTWVLGLANLQARKHYRDGRRRQTPLVPVEEAEDLGDVSTSPSHRLMRAQLLQQTIDELSTEHRVCFVLYEMLKCSHKEIAQIEGIRVGTVHSRLFRARAILEEKTAWLEASDRAGKARRRKNKEPVSS